MKAAVLKEQFKFVIQETEMPRIKADEVLIKVKSAGICSSDVKAYMGIHPEIKYPVILGHEFSGEIAAAGKEVKHLQVDDEVIAEPLFPCNKCRACVSGKYNLCNEQKMIGQNIPGAFAEYVIAKGSMTYPKDGFLSFDEAALIETLATAVHAVKRSRIGIGDTMVILGAGSVGLLCLQVAKRSGATVLIADMDQEKLHLAADLDADYVISPGTGDLQEMVLALTNGYGANIIMDCAGTKDSLRQTVELACRGGNIVLVGWTGDQADSISLTRVTMDEKNLIGTMNYCHDFPIAIDLANSGYVNLKSIITHEFELSQIPEAFSKLSGKDHSIIKAVINFSESYNNP